jgi:hypothetical protein
MSEKEESKGISVGTASDTLRPSMVIFVVCLKCFVNKRILNNK